MFVSNYVGWSKFCIVWTKFQILSFHRSVFALESTPQCMCCIWFSSAAAFNSPTMDKNTLWWARCAGFVMSELVYHNHHHHHHHSKSVKSIQLGGWSLLWLKSVKVCLPYGSHFQSALIHEIVSPSFDLWKIGFTLTLDVKETKQKHKSIFCCKKN